MFGVSDERFCRLETMPALAIEQLPPPMLLTGKWNAPLRAAHGKVAGRPIAGRLIRPLPRVIRVELLVIDHMWRIPPDSSVSNGRWKVTLPKIEVSWRLDGMSMKTGIW